MVDERRMVDLFQALVRYDSESFQEKRIGQEVTKRLENLGLEILTEGATRKEYLERHPDSHPNIFARLQGTTPGEPVLFSAHLDTVSPGKNKQIVISDDGVIHSGGDTVLGADDISGMVSIIEALTVIREEKLDHPDIELLITAAEEPFCEGSRYFRFEQIKARAAYVLDLTGPVGTAADQAPSIVSFEAEILGKAAHAGFAPEEGINALTALVRSLSRIQTGRIDENTTVNIGTIAGGRSNNIVPDHVRVTGEVRSLVPGEALQRTEEILKQFVLFAEEAGGEALCSHIEHIRPYGPKENSLALERFRAACEKEAVPMKVIRTMGGSEANRLNEAGIPSIVIACGMENVHSCAESCRISELVRSAQLSLRLMTLERAGER